VRTNNIQVRGCCCGIPFGCGTLVLLLLGFGLYQYAVPAVWAALTSLFTP